MQENNIDILRFLTCGSVDDGKSTLIGRLLYDSKSIFQDQLEDIEKTSINRGKEKVDLALLTDGLRAEREQGITIDVAYRYFSTPKRKFIIADCPGHIQYTRNMVTGASTCNLALILIDARNGVVEQTRRHAFIASLLGIKHLVVCINKMDLVDFDEQAYKQIESDFRAFASKLNIPDIRFVPVSALDGDNIVNKSERTPWYTGPTVMYILESVHIGSDHNYVDVRFPVQYVIRPQSAQHPDYRAFAGRVESGVIKPGDEVMLYPSGFKTKVVGIDTADGEVAEAYPPMSVSVRIEGNYDLSRGDMIVKSNNQPENAQDIEIMLCWFNEKPINPRGKYIIRHTTRDVKVMVKDIRYKIDINNLHRVEGDTELAMNDIGRVLLRTAKPLYYDEYQRNRATGSLIVVDEFTNETLGAGMIL